MKKFAIAMTLSVLAMPSVSKAQITIAAGSYSVAGQSLGDVVVASVISVDPKPAKKAAFNTLFAHLDAQATATGNCINPGGTRPVSVPADSPLGALLGAGFCAAVTQVPLLSPDLGHAVLQNLCGLVALACGVSEEGRWSGRQSLRAVRLEAAKRYVEQHLAEPGLTPVSTAAALGISVRHLHLLFEPTGTSFAQYVVRRRLLQCRAGLASPIGASRSVADIAFGWGFNSLATFYRAFGREFGLPPTVLRDDAPAGHAD
jgi:AraC-like DNA-binding protein